MRLVGLLLTALALAACGDDSSKSRPKPKQPASVSIDQIIAQNRSARRTHAPRRKAPPAHRRRLTAGHAAPAPVIIQASIPFPAKRRREMAAYAQRHYGIGTYRLRNPRVIVEHYTATADAQAAIDIFTPDQPDSELHELPGVCSHYVIEKEGTIYQLVPLGLMCRHTVGLNYTSIGIEHAGFSDQEILNNQAQMKASLALTRWLRCRNGISIANVIGHNESLSSRFHEEQVARLRTQTHEDWTKADMDVYRARLSALAC